MRTIKLINSERYADKRLQFNPPRRRGVDRERREGKERERGGGR